jgi:hypothetical protein
MLGGQQPGSRTRTSSCHAPLANENEPLGDRGAVVGKVLPASASQEKQHPSGIRCEGGEIGRSKKLSISR